IDQPIAVRNLKRMNDVLGWGYGENELRGCVDELNGHIEQLRLVPIDVRRFLGAIAMRFNRVRNTRAVVDGGMFTSTRILVSDLKGALRLSEQAIFERAS